MAKTIIKKSVKKAATKRTRAATDTNISIAMLEHQAEHSAAQFVSIGNKFDRILDRVEELALSTTNLNTRHDAQIEQLQKQVTAADGSLKQTKDEISKMSTKLVHHVEKEITHSTDQTSKHIDRLSNQLQSHQTKFDDHIRRTDERLSSLERWRMWLLGLGVATGFFLTRFADFLKDLFP